MDVRRLFIKINAGRHTGLAGVIFQEPDSPIPKHTDLVRTLFRHRTALKERAISAKARQKGWWLTSLRPW